MKTKENLNKYFCIVRHEISMQTAKDGVYDMLFTEHTLTIVCYKPTKTYAFVVGCANPQQFSKMLLASGSCGAPWYGNHKYINDF